MADTVSYVGEHAFLGVRKAGFIFQKDGDRGGVVEDALSSLIQAGHLDALARRKCAGCAAHDGCAGGRANGGGYLDSNVPFGIC